MQRERRVSSLTPACPRRSQRAKIPDPDFKWLARNGYDEGVLKLPTVDCIYSAFENNLGQRQIEVLSKATIKEISTQMKGFLERNPKEFVEAAFCKSVEPFLRKEGCPWSIIVCCQDSSALPGIVNAINQVRHPLALLRSQTCASSPSRCLMFSRNP